jgi:hypothetical protein
MEIKFNVTTKNRKVLVTALGEILGVKPIYLGPPSFAFTVAEFTVWRNGTIYCDDQLAVDKIDQVVDGLISRGFEYDSPDLFTIELPITGFTAQAVDNLKRLVAGKASLIKKALGAACLDIVVTEDKIAFPWFRRVPTGEEVNAYSHFLGALAAVAKSLKRVNVQERDEENMKFSFRVFLIRLGFVGREYQQTRKVLLKNLSGNSAFKNGDKHSD